MSQDRFSSTLDLLKGFSVNLYVGEEIVKGKLMGVEEDHVILENENNYIFYYSLDKIQAITKNTKEFQSEEISSEYVKTTRLTDLLASLTHSWVSILCLNKQTFSGIVNEVDSDFVTLVSDEERILIKLSHVSNIVKGIIEDNSSSSDSDSASDSNNEEQSETEVTKQDEEVENSSNESIDIVEEVTAIEEVIVVEEEESMDISSLPVIDNSSAMVWSQSIKPKSIEKEEPTNKQTKSSKSKRDTSSSKEEKSKQNKRSNKEQKSSKSKSSSKKEVSQTKVEEVKTNKETTALKFSDTANIFGSVKENKESKKTTDPNVKNTQKNEEKRLTRFAGEPITRNSSEGAFPFAGWPNRRNRANRF